MAETGGGRAADVTGRSAATREAEVGATAENATAVGEATAVAIREVVAPSATVQVNHEQCASRTTYNSTGGI